MPKRFYKYKLLLDENMAPRSRFPRLNEYYDVKHLRDDCHRGGLPDPAVYRFAVAQRRVLVTENWTDFLSLVGTQDDLGVIGVPSAWTTSQVDTKLAALLRRHTPTYFRGRVRTLGAEDERRAA